MTPAHKPSTSDEPLHDREACKSAIRKLLEQISERNRRLSWFRMELGQREATIQTLESAIQALQADKIKLTEELGLAMTSLTQRESTIQALQAEKIKLTEELNQLRTAVAQGDEARSRLTYAEAELQEIKRSFGYKVMRFYAGGIDRAFPDGTRRGELKKIIVRSLQICLSEGVTNLFRLAWEKVKRREFMIARTVAYPIEGFVKIPEIVKCEMPQGRILLHCDVPRLSSVEPTKVSDTFILDGWALSDHGIGEVKVYLDDSYIGLVHYGTVRPDVAEAYPELPNSHLSGFRKLITLDHLEKKAPHRLRIVAVSGDLPPATVQGLIEVDTNIRLERDLPALGKECQQLAEAKVSVIIPTKCPPADFEQTLERIRNQKGINDPEIAILNSGDRELSPLANDYKATVYNIPSRSFSHGETRNQAAQTATGDYVVFMTDDAIPADAYLLYKMTSVLASDSTIGAVTARQIPRTDADLMYCQAIWGHYRMLGLDRDRVVGSSDLDAKSPQEKRSMCQIDDVCSCFRRTQFLEHKYATDVEYAEDLELGIRLVRRGFKIAQLFTTGVVHSHNRTPLYWARRSYVDFKVLQRLLNLETVDFRSWSVESTNDLLDSVMSLYRSLNLAIDDLVISRYCEYDIAKAFNMIRSRIKHDLDAPAGSHALNQDVSKMLQEIATLLDYRAQGSRDIKHLALRYSASLGTFQEWLANSHKDLSSLEKDFVEALYKLFAVHIGDCFGQYAVYANKTGHHDERTLALDRYFSEGV